MARRISRPVYELLPLLWLLAGCACLAGSYLLREHAASGWLALCGLGLVVLGAAVWLRRRDYRATAAAYRQRGGGLHGAADSPANARDEEPPPA